MMQHTRNPGPLIVGLIALKGTGKTTLARQAVQTINNVDGCSAVRLSMASPLKEGVKAMFSWTDEHVYGPLKQATCPAIGVTPRYAQQTLGTEWGRGMIDTDVWPKAMGRLIDTMYVQRDVVFIDDIRFENEMEWVKARGGICVLLTREAVAGPLPEIPARLMHILGDSKALSIALSLYAKVFKGHEGLGAYLHPSEHLAYRLSKNYRASGERDLTHLDLDLYPTPNQSHAVAALFDTLAERPEAHTKGQNSVFTVCRPGVWRL